MYTKLQKGSIVRAIAGRDELSCFCGFFVVTGLEADTGYCFIADGRSRKLDSPKRKNIKHLRLTDSVLELDEITDKRLRTLLREYSGQHS